jgi:parallel beta-helix repeat protein
MPGMFNATRIDSTFPRLLFKSLPAHLRSAADAGQTSPSGRVIAARHVCNVMRTVASAFAAIRCAGFLFLLCLLGHLPLFATTYTVTNLGDTNAGSGTTGSLRYCITQANANAGADIIGFGSGLPGAPIVLTNGALIITDALTINGPYTISGNDISRVFVINSGVTATVSNLIIQNGAASDGAAGIFNQGTLTLTNCTLQNNRTTGATSGGGVFNIGTLIAQGCTFANNAAGRLGGGIFSDGTGRIMLDACTIRQNTAGFPIGGAGIYINTSGSNSTIRSCVIEGNANDGIMFQSSSSLTLINCIVANNRGSGILFGTADAARISAFNCTVAFNSIGIQGRSPLSLVNCIVSGSNGSANNVIAPNASFSNTFIDNGPNTPQFFSNTDFRLRPGSPCIDAGTTDTTGLNLPSTDLFGRPRVLGVRIDIGAYETANALIVTNGNDAGVGSLRQALGEASAFQIPAVQFASGVSTVTLTSSSLTPSNEIQINGDSAGVTIQRSSTASLFRIFDIGFSDIVQFRNLTISGGNSNTDGGGGIDNSGTLSLVNCRVQANTSPSVGSGGIRNSGSLTLINSVVSANSCSFTGGVGGGIFNTGSLSLINSVVSGNRGWGSAGIHHVGSALSLINSTVTGNAANNYGGGGGISSFSNATLVNSIIAQNSATSGTADLSVSTGTFTATYSLFQSSSGTISGGTGNVLGQNPLFIQAVPAAPSIGGNLRLRPTSPAVNSGTPDTTGLNLPTLDLSGRSRIAGGRIDMGAFEFTPQTLFVTNGNNAGAGSLRQTILDAAEFDSVRFTGVSQVTLTTGELGISKSLVIDARDSTSRLVTLALNQLSLRNGNLTAANTNGGGITTSGSLLMTNSEIRNCSATNAGGALFINSSGSATLRNCVIAGNTDIQGAVFLAIASASLLNCTISGNSSSGITNNNGTLTLKNSAVIFNAGANLALFGGTFNNLGGNLTTNPVLYPFHSPTNLRLIPVATSLIGQGLTDANLLPTDLDGNPRPLPPATTPSIGAYEALAQTPSDSTSLAASGGTLNQSFGTTGISLNLTGIVPANARFLALKFNTGRTGSLASSNAAPYYWVISTNAQSLNGSAIFDWSSIPFNGVGNPATVQLFRRNGFGTSWNSLVTGGSSTRISASAITGFSEFTLGGESDNPLPVELTAFTGQRLTQGITLNWTTGSERDNLGFELQRKTDSDPEFRALANYLTNPRELRGRGTTTQSTTYTFADNAVEDGKTYIYRLVSVDLNGTRHTYPPIVSVRAENVAAKTYSFALTQNYPNPFNPTTIINYQVAAQSDVRLEVFDVLGRKVATLVSERQTAGRYAVNFNAASLASGIYFYRLDARSAAGTFSKTMKLMLVK